MDVENIAAILTPLAWPVTAVIVVFSFRESLITLLSRLSESLSVKTIKLKVFGAEIELTPEQAKSALDELLKDIVETTNELSAEEIALFQEIQAADGRRTIKDLIPSFVRGNEQHKQFRVLRDRKLIRPFEGGRWDTSKHPVVTRFGDLICRIKPEALAKNNG